jgi:alkylated DNA repair dioxygenase AlkB
MNIQKITLEDNCECYYIQNYLNDNQCNALINHIENEYDFVAPKIKIFGKIIDQPRETVWIGPQLQKDELDRKLIKMSDDKLINTARKDIEKIIQKTINKKISFNACLINRYDSGKKSVGYHDDLEDNLEDDPYIASLSLGSTRKFKLKQPKLLAPDII